jgi:uncharacterized protein (TIGR02996 family)
LEPPDLERHVSEESAFLAAIAEKSASDATRLIYADWLEDHSDERTMFVRAHVRLRRLAPDHPQRVALEHELSRLRRGQDREWLKIIEPERAHLYAATIERVACSCMDAQYDIDRQQPPRWPMMELHHEPQDTECEPWQRLCALFEEAAADGRTEFAPLRDFDLAARVQIVTLPPTIAKLKAVERLELYGSSLVRIPAEIGEMTNLRYFSPYTSYRLHWFPYEITRCVYLADSVISTRALYGNYSYRPPFPALGDKTITDPVRRACSVCGEQFLDREAYRVWVSLTVATDVVPLLVNACSHGCVDRIRKPPRDYVKRPHRGGPIVNQPPRRSVPIPDAPHRRLYRHR